MDRAKHAEQRIGRITGSVAEIVFRGGQPAWQTLIAQLWGDDGSDFAGDSRGARAHGQLMEDVAIGMFWERHPEAELEDPKFLDFHDPAHPWAAYLGVSPDRIVTSGQPWNRPLAGIEAKNPVVRGVFEHYRACCDAGVVPREHECQIRFGMWCRKLPCWWFVAQHGGDYTELLVTRDHAWERQWEARLSAFMAMYLDGKAVTRDKLGADLLDDI